MVEKKKRETAQDRLATQKKRMERQMSAASSIVDILGGFSEREQTAVCEIVIKALNVYISGDC